MKIKLTWTVQAKTSQTSSVFASSHYTFSSCKSKC